MGVYFSAHINHIGFYPTASGIEAFTEEIKGYKSSKGAVRVHMDNAVAYGFDHQDSEMHGSGESKKVYEINQGLPIHWLIAGAMQSD
jgi:hypothetical protein